MSTIKTPELAKAAGALARLIEAADQGIANLEQGRVLVSATNGQCRVIKTDMERRLADGKLRELDAKDITPDNGAALAPPEKPLPSPADAIAMLRTAASMLEHQAAA
jgi:hypothetical protein